MTDRTPQETVEEFIRAYNAHDVAANHATVAPSFVRYGFTTNWEPMGFDSYKGIFEPFLAAFPDFAWEVTNLIAAGDWVATEVVETATFVNAYHYRPGMVISPTGKSYRCHYAVFFKVLDGLITEYRFYEDSSFVTQLGIDAGNIVLKT